MNYRDDTYNWLPNRPNTFLNTNKYRNHVLMCKLPDSETGDELRKCIFACTGYDYGRPSCDPDFKKTATSAMFKIVEDDIKSPDSKFRKKMEEKGYPVVSQKLFEQTYTALDDLSRSSTFTKVNEGKNLYSHYIFDDVLSSRVHEIQNPYK